MKRRFIVVFVLLFVMALVADILQQEVIKNGYVERAPLGGEEKELKLRIEAEGVLADQDYFLNVSPELPKQEQAEKFFQEAIDVIEKDFSDVETEVPLQESYLKGIVTAEWSFRPFGIVDESGQVVYERLDNNGTIVEAQVELRCGDYERIFTFPFQLNPPKLTEKEELLKEIELWIDNQMKMEGSKKIKLPTKIRGTELSWSQKKDYITPQVLFLEIVAFVLLKVVSKRKQTEEEKTRLAKMEADYPDVVNQLALLLGAGMTTRQAWNRIATQYAYKRKENLITTHEVYDAIARMSRCLREGETERVVYQRFMEEIPLSNYRKLMRLLLANLEKGSGGIAIALGQESQSAFEQKILQVKKMGEEASTKMLFPLILMLVMVMGIVMLPALMKFQI